MQLKNSGNASLIALIIGVGLTAVGFVYFFLTPRTQTNSELRAAQPTTASGTVPTTEFERAVVDINAAKAAQELINTHNRATNAVLAE